MTVALAVFGGITIAILLLAAVILLYSWLRYKNESGE